MASAVKTPEGKVVEGGVRREGARRWASTRLTDPRPALARVDGGDCRVTTWNAGTTAGWTVGGSGSAMMPMRVRGDRQVAQEAGAREPHARERPSRRAHALGYPPDPDVSATPDAGRVVGSFLSGRD